jgi:hypothetical protein
MKLDSKSVSGADNLKSGIVYFGKRIWNYGLGLAIGMAI